MKVTNIYWSAESERLRDFFATKSRIEPADQCAVPTGRNGDSRVWPETL